MNTVIEASNLTKRFGDFTAVEDLSMRVSEGEILGLLGPNGAGKTTTTRMLAGMVAPTSGYAEVAGYRTDKEVEDLHEVIGLLTETPGLYERFSARDNLLYFARFYDIDAETQVDKYLKTMGLWERRNLKAGAFSKGMKQRLSLARALLHEPKVLFFDEPTAGLDPESAQEVRRLVLRLKEEGRTIFLTTHNLDEAESLCDRVAVLSNRLVVLDKPDNLRTRLFQRKAIVDLESISKEVVEAIDELGFVRRVEKKDNRLIVEMEDFDKNRPTLVRRIVEVGGNVKEIYEEEHSLEDVYLALMKEDKEAEA